MSGNAGGLSYSNLTTFGKATLPSVDNWYNNTNILKDPPKSIHTRKIDKVGETSSITTMIDESGTRSCEYINQYARGVNPFVSVDYGNNGNNGGQRTNGIQIGGQQQAKLPYRILQNGQFRPPILRQENLYPLSRLPRVWTNALTNPAYPNFAKKIKNCKDDDIMKEVRNKTLKVCVRPNAVFKLEKPITEPFEVKYVIQNPLKTTANSGIRTMDRTQQYVQEPSNGIDHNNLHVNARTNVNKNIYLNNSEFYVNPYLQENLNINANTNGNKNIYVNNSGEFYSEPYIQEYLNINANTNVNQNKYVNSSEFYSEPYLQEHINTEAITNPNQNIYINNNELNTDPYLQETIYNNVTSNPNSSKHFTYIDDILDLSSVKVKDSIYTDYITPLSGIEKHNYIHENIELERNLPEYSAKTNIGQNIHKRINQDNELKLNRITQLSEVYSNPSNPYTIGNNSTISSREYNRLHDKVVSPGGFDGKGTKPLLNKNNNIPIFENEKMKMNKNVMEQFQGRYNTLPNNLF
jgi:hypothetical protein